MRLLIIGKLEGHISTASRIALSRGAKVNQSDTIEGGLEHLRSGRSADLVMVDVSLNIQKLTQALQQERFSMPVVACGFGTDASQAAQSIRDGAREYVPLPPDPELIAAVLESVAHEDDTLVTKDPSMVRLMKLAEQIAPSDASVLITGESGTGKEVMARYIHQKSHRKERQFISVNCAAIPDNLLESELFGHEKGSFTGAVARRIGKFEEANGGTLLLDEISEMQPALQAKLLRAIQEREIDRVGGTKPVPIDIRIVATSNRNLEEEVKKGTFREDLYFRLNVVPLQLPPLRQRPLDIETLAEYFVKKYTQTNALPLRGLSDDAKTALRQHPWKGNIRELENTMHRAVLLASGDVIEITDLGLGASSFQAANEPQVNHKQNLLVGRTVSEVERDLIIGTLSHCLGNRTQAATILGISIRTLRNKLRLYAQEGYPLPQTSDDLKEAI
jgi:two-component system response regulator FlrC